MNTKDGLADWRRVLRKEILRQMTLTDAAAEEAEELDEVLANLNAAVDTGIDPDKDNDPAKTIRFYSELCFRRGLELLRFANVAEAMRFLPLPPAPKKAKAEVQAVAAE